METQAAYEFGKNIADIIEDEQKDEFDGIEIINHKIANGILGRIQAERREIALLEEQAQDERARIDARLTGLTEPRRAHIEYLTTKYQPLMEEFARQELEGQSKRSITLLSGTIGFRKAPARLEIEDESALMEWAREHLADAIQIKESVLKTPVKAYIEGTGEVVPGAEYVKGEDVFYIK